MHRRTVLAAGAAVLTAGCSRLRPDYTPSVSDRPLAEYACPPEGVDAPGMVCATDPETAEGPLTLAASVRVTEDPDAVELTLTNASDDPVPMNPGSWDVWVEQDGDWEPVEQTAFADGSLELQPGEQRRWTAREVLDVIRTNAYEFLPGTYLIAKVYQGVPPGALVRITDG